MLNAEATIAEQLEALAAQSYRGDWEVIVADNGSSDRSISVATARSDRFPSFRVIDASERRVAAFARNAGVAAGSGDVILMCDADDVVDEGWIEALIIGLSECDLVTGRNDNRRLNGSDVQTWYERSPGWARAGLLSPEHAAAGGNFGISRRHYEELGGYSEDYARGDVEFTGRALASGLSFASVPSAVVHVRLRSTYRELAAQCMARGRVLGSLQADQRELRGGPRHVARYGLRKVVWVLVSVPGAVVSRGRRGQLVRSTALATGWCLGRLTTLQRRRRRHSR